MMQNQRRERTQGGKRAWRIDQATMHNPAFVSKFTGAPRLVEDPAKNRCSSDKAVPQAHALVYQKNREDVKCPPVRQSPRLSP